MRVLRRQCSEHSVVIISFRWVGVLTHVRWNKVWILTMVPVAEQVPQLLRDKQVGWNKCPNCLIQAGQITPTI